MTVESVEPRDYVTWPELLEWAKAHGAVNEAITSISLGTRNMTEGELAYEKLRGSGLRATVTIEGNAFDDKSRPYTVTDGGGRNRLAKWVVTNQLLRWLP